ncbi:hypothetical protein MTO96_029170 [Rhipicephalus appendiculatus]
MCVRIPTIVYVAAAGRRAPPEDHQCTPSCQLCGSNHQTADRTCKARYKTPYIVKRRRWERQQQDSPMPTPVRKNADQQDSVPPSTTRRPGPVKIPFTVQIQVTEPNTWTTSVEVGRRSCGNAAWV